MWGLYEITTSVENPSALKASDVSANDVNASGVHASNANASDLNVNDIKASDVSASNVDAIYANASDTTASDAYASEVNASGTDASDVNSNTAGKHNPEHTARKPTSSTQLFGERLTTAKISSETPEWEAQNVCLATSLLRLTMQVMSKQVTSVQVMSKQSYWHQ